MPFDKLKVLISELVESIVVVKNTDKSKFAFETKLRNFDHKLMYVADKQLKTFELYRLKAQDQRDSFENNFITYFNRFTSEQKKKFKEKYFDSYSNSIKYADNYTLQITISHSNDEDEFYNNNSADYLDDETLFDEITDNILVKSLYEKLTIQLDTKNLIRFYPIPPRKKNL